MPAKKAPALAGSQSTLTIIYLPGQPRGVLASVLSLAERMMLMSTYEELQIILGVAMLIIAILNLNNK